MAEEQLRPYKPTLERIEFYGRIGLGSGVGYVVGLAGKNLMIFVGEGIDTLLGWRNVAFPSAASVDKRVTEVLEKVPGGQTAIEMDKKASGLWEQLLGRTPEKQKAWREKYGIKLETEARQSTQADPSQQYKTGTQTAQPVPVQLYGYGDMAKYYGDPLVSIAILVGALYGTAKGLTRYVDARRQATLINANIKIHNLLSRLEGGLKGTATNTKEDTDKKKV